MLVRPIRSSPRRSGARQVGRRATLLCVIVVCSMQHSCKTEPRRSSSPALPANTPENSASARAPASVAPPTTSSPATTTQSDRYTIEPRRCAPDDPECLPEPYNGSEDMVVDTLSGSPYRYRASAKRYPLGESEDRSEGSCEHDGDCLAGPACGTCVSRLRVPPPRPCALTYQGEFDGAFCGCVEKRCSWFTQRLKRRVVSTTTNLKVELAGKPTSDAALLKEAAELFELELDDCYVPRQSLLPATHRFVVTVGKYGHAETDVSGAHPSVHKCVFDTFRNMTQVPNWISNEFLRHGTARFTGVIDVRLAWVP